MTEECCVCYENLSQSYLECGHPVHISCIERHFIPECPVCRAKINVKVKGTRPTMSYVFDPTEFIQEPEDEDELPPLVGDQYYSYVPSIGYPNPSTLSSSFSPSVISDVKENNLSELQPETEYIIPPDIRQNLHLSDILTEPDSEPRNQEENKLPWFFTLPPTIDVPMINLPARNSHLPLWNEPRFTGLISSSEPTSTLDVLEHDNEDNENNSYYHQDGYIYREEHPEYDEENPAGDEVDYD